MLRRIGHIPIPYSVQGSSITYIVQQLSDQHRAVGGQSVVALAHNRDGRVQGAENLLVDYTKPSPLGYFTHTQARLDVLRGRAGLRRRLYPSLFAPAVDALRSADLDAVVVHEGHHATEALPSVVAGLPGVRTAVHINTPPSRTYSRRELRRFLGSVDVVIAASRSIADKIDERTGRAFGAVVVPNGVADLFFEAESVRGAPLVTFAGQVAEHKGVHLMLDAVARIASRHPGIRVKVVGSSSHAKGLGLSAYEQRLRHFAAAHLPPGAAEFIPYADRSTLAATFAGSAVVCVPSIWDEPFGMVAAEAMASGAPVLAARRGGLVDFVRQEDLIDPTDVDVFAARMDEYVANRALADEVGTINRQHAAAYAWPAVYERWSAALERGC